ncbi:MAG TPA: hypothetical protein VK468_00915 [Pyrinomonadaceae bacterium]|nr:hypothetical protein [Pyrinomonadaceae bacterium]
MRTSALYTVTASILFALLVTSCSQAENKSSTGKPNAAPTASQTAVPAASKTPTPFVSETAALPVSRIKPLPPTGGDKPIEAKFNGFAYSYKKDGTKTVATFGTKLLPWDRDVAAGAIRDIIDRSYGDKLDSVPQIAGTGAEQTIRIAGQKHEYVVVLIREANGEIRSLIITQLTD